MLEEQYYDISQTHPHHIPIPNTYVGHESFLHPQHAANWNIQHMPNYQYGHAMQQPSYTNNGHLMSPTNAVFAGPQLQQHSIQPQFANNWQHNYQIPVSTRVEMQFGSDPHFLNNGYAAPDGAVEQDLTVLTHAMQPMSSGSNTQPHSAAGSNVNTEPSSPTLPKKRKANTFEQEELRMTSVNGNVKPNGLSNSRKGRKSFVENQPPTPISKPSTAYEEDEDPYENGDAEFDQDEDVENPDSPAGRSSKNRKSFSTPKPTKSRKKAAQSHQKPLRRESAGPIAPRTPLTVEQKKANHTNSEQRRRDATSKAFADLYDLVPETEDGGKNSTMKKMGLVVEKVHAVSARLEYLRRLVAEGQGHAHGHFGPWS